MAQRKPELRVFKERHGEERAEPVVRANAVEHLFCILSVESAWLSCSVSQKTMPETYAYFYIHGFQCDPDVITAHLGIPPSKIWRAGDPAPIRKNHFYDYSGWQVESGLPRNSYDMSAPVASVVDMLLERFEKFSTLPPHEEKGIYCVGYYFSENPGFALTPELAAKVAKLGLRVDFDLYNLRDSDELWFMRAPEDRG